MSETSYESLTDQKLPEVDTDWALFDTTEASVGHNLYCRLKRTPSAEHFALPELFCASIAITFVPLLAAALFSPIPLATATDAHPLPFLHDWNMLFMFLISFPCLVVLVVTDQDLLTRALSMVRSDGTIVLSPGNEHRLAIRWSRIFRVTNQLAQGLGLLVGGVVAHANDRAYAPAAVELRGSPELPDMTDFRVCGDDPRLLMAQRLLLRARANNQSAWSKA